jgi:hypothetical protein
MQANSPEAGYRARAERFAASAADAGRRERLLSWTRLVVFGLALLLLVRMELRGGSGFGVAAVALLAVVFLVLVVLHERVRVRRARLEALAAVNREGIERIERRFRALPAPPATGELADHPYAADLDVLGPASLEQLAGPTGTSAGRARLRAWLLQPAPVAEVEDRQQAVRELASAVELRDAFAAAGRLGGQPRAGELTRFSTWASSRERHAGRVALVALAWLLPPLTILLFILGRTGAVGPSLWSVSLVLQVAVGILLAGRVNALFEEAFPRQEMFRGTAELFRLLDEFRPACAPLRRLQTQLAASGQSPRRAIRSLERLMELADSRRSGFGFLLHLATLWQFHVLAALERWRDRHGSHVPDWFDQLATADALSALAALPHDQPAWVFPRLQEGGPAGLRGRALGHPLLHPSARVDNDVELPPQGRFLLVTGSNMSGKSTLLRAIGANAVLAQAGAPVCAQDLELSPCRIWTSMRVQDSLERGVSRFLAELSRIRDVVQAAGAPGGGEPPLLYLLDEILQGTNTSERRVGARSVIRHLLRRDAFGAITTHDLTLADSADLEKAGIPVHFREHVARGDDGVQMTFDYRLRPGLATSTNALVLVEMMGLGGEARSEA